MQFDVYENTDKDTNKTFPFFLDIQTNLLDTLNSRVVVPLTPMNSVNKEYPQSLCPVIEIKSNYFALLTHQVTSIPTKLLKKKTLSADFLRDEIVAAIDFVVTGI